MNYQGEEQTQTESEFFGLHNNLPSNICKEYSVSCITGDFDKKLGYVISYKPLEFFEHLFEDCDPIYLATEDGSQQLLLTVDDATKLLLKHNILEAMFYFDSR